MIQVVTVFDAIHDNIGHMPPGRAAGYSTGAGSHIRWTPADWASHPGAVRIDQDAIASDPTADVLDVEAGAATTASAPGWVMRAAACYSGARRPGQRRPAIYMSRSRVTEVVNALTRAGITSGAGLWVADWGMTQAQAITEVQAAAGPFPVIAVQHANLGTFDESVFSLPWLQDVSAAPAAGMRITVPPPGTWKDGALVTVIGPGPEGKTAWVTTTSDGKNWTAPAPL
jgi:hypothetical protein